jgi:Lon protease-like protein
MRDEETGLKMLPIFPLNTVLMPHQLMPLHIFENRYRRLMADLLALPESEQRFGIVSIVKGSETNEDLPQLAEIGTIAVLRKTTSNPDGTFEITVIGGERFDIKSISVSKAPYLIGEVRTRKETPTNFDRATITLAQEKCIDFMMMIDADNDNASRALPDEPSALSFLIAGLLPLTSIEQQGLLNIDDANLRLKAVMKIINRETILMQEIPSVPAPFLTRVTISPN